MVFCDGKYLGYVLVEFLGGVCVCEGGEHLFLHFFKVGWCVALAEFNTAYFEFVVGEDAVVAGEGADTGLFAGEEDNPAVVCFDIHAYARVGADETGEMYGAGG